MISTATRFRVATILGGIMGCLPLPAQAPSRGIEAAIRVLAARQFGAQAALTGSANERIMPADFHVTIVGHLDSLLLYRVSPPGDHVRPYLMTAVDGKPLGLGGFASLDVEAIARALPKIRGDSACAQRARVWAILLDPNSAGEIVWDAPREQPDRYTRAVLAAWHRRRPRDWPRGGPVDAPADGQRRIVVTTLTRNSQSYDLGWQAIAYAFVLDQSGTVIAWAQRLGPDFSVHGLPAKNPTTDILHGVRR